MALVQISDVIVPSIFTPYFQQQTEEKTRILQAGAAARDAAIDALLTGGGLTFNVPSWKDLSNNAENISTDSAIAYGAGDAVPDKVGTAQEVAVRLSRNMAWSAADLVGVLAGADPMAAIGQRVGYYWARRAQAAFVATLKGVFADNDAAPSGSEHVRYDLTNDISGSSFVDGVTNFSAEAFLDAALTMGDSMEDLAMVMVHSVVYNRMQKNNLIDFIPDSTGAVNIPTFLGRRVIVDDGMPASGGVYDTWLFGAGAIRWGVGAPRIPVEIDRKPEAGNGGGQEILYTRVEWAFHPVGYKYAGTAPNGGPSNAATTNNLAHLDSWIRVYPERKQVKIARLKTRES